MKRILAVALTGALLFGTGATFADEAGNKDDGAHHHHHWIWHHFHIAGTVDHWDSGQLFIRTPQNQLIQVPHMAMQYNIDPRVTFATVNAGTAVVLHVPRRDFHEVAARNGWHELVNPDGTWYVPDAVWDDIHAHKKHKHHLDGDKIEEKKD